MNNSEAYHNGCVGYVAIRLNNEECTTHVNNNQQKSIWRDLKGLCPSFFHSNFAQKQLCMPTDNLQFGNHQIPID
jgi:hypothetical protein